MIVPDALDRNTYFIKGLVERDTTHGTGSRHTFPPIETSEMEYVSAIECSVASSTHIVQTYRTL